MPTRDELITKALHDRADQVDRSTLRSPRFDAERADQQVLPRRSPPRPSILLSAAATIIVVLAVVVGVYSLRPNHRDGGPTAGGGSASMLTNKRWVLSGVRTATSTYPVPTDYRAQLAFTDKGRVSGLDGLNAIGGSYRTSGDTITIRITEAGTAGGTGTFPADDAMTSIYVPTSLAQDSVTSTYSLTADKLTLNSGRWTVTFDAQPLQQGSSGPSAVTPSSTRT